MTVHEPPDLTSVDEEDEQDAIDVSAFGTDSKSDAAAEERFNAEHDDEGNLIRIPQDEGTDDRYEGAATLQALGVTNASNGKNYLLKFEVDRELGQVFFETRNGHDVYWRGLRIGEGVTVKSGAVKLIADGRRHVTIVLQMSENWAARSGAKILADELVGQTGKMRLQPMQMALDLTARAE